MTMEPQSLFPHINASLNALATFLLVVGFILIRQRKETAHKWTMLACFVVSSIFLVCYLIYHYIAGHKEFSDNHPSWLRTTYYSILISHIVLAIYVPVGAIFTIRHGLQDNRTKHRKWARVTFPIWLYVSVTGVVVYWMLYRIEIPS